MAKEKQKLDITFHNPNSKEDLIKALTQILAEMAYKQVKEQMEIIADEELVKLPETAEQDKPQSKAG